MYSLGHWTGFVPGLALPWRGLGPLGSWLLQERIPEQVQVRMKAGFTVAEKEARCRFLETKSGWSCPLPPRVASVTGHHCERGESTHPSGCRWICTWALHQVSQFLESHLFPRVDCFWALRHHILTLPSGWEGVLFLIWSILEVSWHLCPWVSPSTWSVSFHYNDGIISFGVVFWSIFFSPPLIDVVLASPVDVDFCDHCRRVLT